MNAKKILAGACASLMLAVAATPVVSAADSVKVTVGSAEAKAGEDFTVNIDLADIPAAGINGCDFGIKYDSSVITIKELKLGELAKDEDELEGVTALVANLDEPGLVSIVYGLGLNNKANYMTGEGTFLVLSGTVNDDAAAGSKSDLKVVAVDRLADGSGNSTTVNSDIIFGNLGDDGITGAMYTPTITNGVVTVPGGLKPTEGPTAPTETLPPYTGIEELMYGDVNLDNTVSPADIVQLVKYIISPTTYPVGKGTPETIAKAKEQGDVAKDSLLNTKDTGKLKERILENITQDELGK